MIPNDDTQTKDIVARRGVVATLNKLIINTAVLNTIDYRALDRLNRVQVQHALHAMRGLFDRTLRLERMLADLDAVRADQDSLSHKSQRVHTVARSKKLTMAAAKDDEDSDGSD
jgi:hypothetical protein